MRDDEPHPILPIIGGVVLVVLYYLYAHVLFEFIAKLGG